MFLEDTIAAVATGMTSSGIGIIRISGPASFDILGKIFRTKSGRVPSRFESHRVYYGYIYDEEVLLDEVLAIPMRSPKSYTAEDTVEIDCHGGMLVLDNVLKLVLKTGARAAEPGEFTKRAFLNGRIDLSEAESVIDVINSKNNYALNNSLKQLTGRLNEKIRYLRGELLNEIAYIEAALDDPEHISLDGYADRIGRKCDDMIHELDKLLNSFDNGRIIREGIKTAILGKPNAGKSSLLNFLSGSERAIVTDIPGTTRDIIEENVRLDNLLLVLCDTAGIRESDDTVERLGVEKAKSYASDSDLIIFVIDSSVPLDENDTEIFKFIRDKKALILLNKSDLDPQVSVSDVKKRYHDCDPCCNDNDISVLSVSVKTGEGFDLLNKELNRMFLSGVIDYDDEIMISNERHRNLLEKAAAAMNNARLSVTNNMPEDFISIDLTDCYDLLGMIIGEKIGDDVADKIFSDFCVGK